MALKSRLTQLKSKAKAATVEDDQEDEVVTTKAPVKKLGGLKGLKAKPAPEPEDDDEDLDDEDLDDDSEEEEEEVVAKPAPKKALGKKFAAKPAPEPEEDDEDLDDEDDSDEDEEEEEVVAKPAPKKALGKAKAKPAPEPEEDDEDLDDEDDSDEDEEEEVVAKPVVKKALGKAKAKPAPEPEEDDEDEDEDEVKTPAKKTVGKKASTKSEEPAAKKTLFNGKAPKKERVLEENSILTREELASRLAAKADTTLVDAREMLSAVEDVLLEAIQKYQLNFMGVRFKRRLQAQRDHSGVGGIDLGESNFKAELVTRVFPHYVSTLRVVCDRQVAKGIMRDEEFVEGNFDDKGNFIEGTWHTPEGTKTPVFTPSTPRAGKVVKKGKK